VPTKTKRPTFSWGNTTVADQTKLMDTIGGDGHTIWSAPALIEDGVPTYIIDHFTTVEKSDGSWKGSITSTETGDLVEELRGVYGLTVIRSLAGYYSVYSHKFGRGSEARELTDGIRVHLAEATAETGA
jgi:hypothetical protein